MTHQSISSSFTLGQMLFNREGAQNDDSLGNTKFVLFFLAIIYSVVFLLTCLR